MIYAIYKADGTLHDLTPTEDEAKSVAARFVGSFIKSYAKLGDVPRNISVNDR